MLDGGTELPYETEEMICTAAGHTEYVDLAYSESHEAEIEATMREHRCRQLRRRVAELSCGLDYMLTNEAFEGSRVPSGAPEWSVDPARVAFVGHR